jgi:hypothetical protein
MAAKVQAKLGQGQQVQVSKQGQGHQVQEQGNHLQGGQQLVSQVQVRQVEGRQQEGSQDIGKVNWLISCLETTSENTMISVLFWTESG